MAEDSPAPESPYVQAANSYRAAGWRGVLPLPAKSKKPVPTGYTGHDGVDPQGPDIQEWLDSGMIFGGAVVPSGNIALRLPRHIVGLDVDHYDDKQGMVSYGAMLGQWGALPATWRSSARTDGISGIYLFNAPMGLVWPGAPKPGVEIIQYGHRYAVVWPSLHPEGGTYRWYEPGGAVALNRIPQVDELPALPESWVEGLTGGVMRGDVAKAGLASDSVQKWLDQHGAGSPCESMTRAANRYVNEFALSGISRHDIAMRATARVARLIVEGHPGGALIISTMRAEFAKALAKSANRDSDTGEFARLIDGAVNLAAVDAVSLRDPCHDYLTYNGGVPSQPVSNASIPASGTSPSAPSSNAGASGPAGPTPSASSSGDPSATPTEASPEPTLDALMLAQELTRQRAQRGARRSLDEEEALALFREPVWVRTLTEELQLPDSPVPFVVTEVMPAGANVLLTAQFKAGKTTLVNNLARSLVDGLPFLDRFDVSGEHRIGIFNYEVNRDQYRMWLRDAAIENTDRVSVLNLRGYRMPLITPRIEDWIVKWLIEHEITCWVLDPFARAFVGSGDNENDNSLVGRFLDSLDIIKERASVSELVMPTHTGRAAHEVGSERARGATRLDDWADVRWLLTTDDEDKRYFRAIGRDVDFAEVQLGYNAGTRRQFIEGPGRKKKDSQDLRAEILKAVRTNPGITATGIYEIVRGTKKTTLAKVTSMVGLGDLRREGSEYAGYRHFIAEERKLHLVPEVVREGGSGGSEAVLPGGSRAYVSSPNHGGSEPSSSNQDDDDKAVSIALTRPQLESQTAAYREALAAGKKPRYQNDGSLISADTGELLWAPE